MGLSSTAVNAKRNKGRKTSPKARINEEQSICSKGAG